VKSKTKNHLNLKITSNIGGKNVSETNEFVFSTNRSKNQFRRKSRIGTDRENNKLGRVNRVGNERKIAPKGQDEWAVSKTKKKYITKERARGDGVIGTVKTPLYGFNNPNARSIKSIESCGQRSFLGFNLKKLIREKMKLEFQAA